MYMCDLPLPFGLVGPLSLREKGRARARSVVCNGTKYDMPDIASRFMQYNAPGHGLPSGVLASRKVFKRIKAHALLKVQPPCQGCGTFVKGLGLRGVAARRLFPHGPGCLNLGTLVRYSPAGALSVHTM